jgi:hypothetical protein
MTAQADNEIPEIPGPVAPPHPVQDLIVTALQGQMKMRREYPRRGQAFKEIFIEGKGLEGSETEPGQAIQVGQGPDEITQVDAEVPAIEP